MKRVNQRSPNQNPAADDRIWTQAGGVRGKHAIHFTTNTMLVLYIIFNPLTSALCAPGEYCIYRYNSFYMVLKIWF